MTNLSDIIRDNFSAKKIVIVGDLVADQFLRGTIVRVSREAPVFILKHDETETLPGGAANAAVNVASLGGAAVVIGKSVATPQAVPPTTPSELRKKYQMPVESRQTATSVLPSPS